MQQHNAAPNIAFRGCEAQYFYPKARRLFYQHFSHRSKFLRGRSLACAQMGIHALKAIFPASPFFGDSVTGGMLNIYIVSSNPAAMHFAIKGASCESHLFFLIFFPASFA